MKRLFLILIIGLIFTGNGHTESIPVVGTYSNATLVVQDLFHNLIFNKNLKAGPEKVTAYH